MPWVVLLITITYKHVLNLNTKQDTPDSGRNGNSETEITSIHPLSARGQHVLYDGSSDGTRVAVVIVQKETE